MSMVPLRVGDYMTRDLVTVAPDTEITQVIQVLIDKDISGVLVVEHGGKLVGIVTERDCLAVATEAGYHDEWGGPAASYMSAPVETASPGENLVDVALRMSGSIYRRFPVVEDGALVGLIGRRDVLRALGSGSWFAAQRPEEKRT